MNKLVRILGGLSFVGFAALYSVACVAPVGPESEEITSEESEAVSGEENVSVAEQAIGTCHGFVTCPDPKSCSGWSSYYNCGTMCVADRACGGCGPIPLDPDCIPDGTGVTRQFTESFRVCTLQNGTSCTEYRGSAYKAECGCEP